MLKRLLNTVLVVSLVLSVTGASYAKIFCQRMSIVVEKSCCSDNTNNDGCCKKAPECNKPGSDIISINASVDVPAILLFATAVYNYPDFSAIMFLTENVFTIYSPPLSIRDIPVLFKIFRI